jgi:hypothetical protein
MTSALTLFRHAWRSTPHSPAWFAHHYRTIHIRFGRRAAGHGDRDPLRIREREHSLDGVPSSCSPGDMTPATESDGRCIPY